VSETTMRAVLTPEGSLAVLAKEFCVRLLNCSASGCLIETSAPLDVGTVGSLRLVWNGDEVTENVQVVRCQRIEGAGSLFHVGAQFLWMAAEGGSFRRALRCGTMAALRPDGGRSPAL
jgi:hypothetical protein